MPNTTQGNFLNACGHVDRRLRTARVLNKKKPPENGVEPTRAADSQTDSRS